MNKTNIYFITGTSGSGKSILVTKLKNELLDYEIHDFDSLGVPIGADEVAMQVVNRIKKSNLLY